MAPFHGGLGEVTQHQTPFSRGDCIQKTDRMLRHKKYSRIAGNSLPGTTRKKVIFSFFFREHFFLFWWWYCWQPACIFFLFFTNCVVRRPVIPVFLHFLVQFFPPFFVVFNTFFLSGGTVGSFVISQHSSSDIHPHSPPVYLTKNTFPFCSFSMILYIPMYIYLYGRGVGSCSRSLLKECLPCFFFFFLYEKKKRGGGIRSSGRHFRREAAADKMHTTDPSNILPPCSFLH